MNREKIRKLYNKAKGLLEDQRPSQQLGPIGAPMFVVQSTPETIREAQSLPVKKEFLDIILDMLRESPVSQSMKRHMFERASVCFDHGFPAEYILTFAVGRIVQGEWKLFDPASNPDHEREVLDATIRALYWNLIGAQMVFLSEEETVKLSTAECRAMFVDLFTASGSYPWPTVANLSAFFQREGPLIRIQWTDYFRRAKDLVNWIEQFRSHWSEPEAFNDEEPTLRKLARYYLTFKV